MANHYYRSFRSIVLIAALLGAGCSGVQSTLDPASREAERIYNLFWWMAVGSIVVWLAVIVLAIYCARAASEGRSQRWERLLIIGGGAVVPTVVLAVLLVFGLSLIPALVAPAPAGSLQVSVSGEQWWWRVRYHTESGDTVELANEIRLPVGQPVQFRLDSPDVIHSFWIPSLSGKIDMIPGRVTWLALTPTRTGFFRGACAEYCGTSHALMTFNVQVMENGLPALARAAALHWYAGVADATPRRRSLGHGGILLRLPKLDAGEYRRIVRDDVTSRSILNP